MKPPHKVKTNLNEETKMIYVLEELNKVRISSVFKFNN